MIDTMTSAIERFGKRDIAIAAVLSLLGVLLMYGNVADLTDGTARTEDQQAAIRFGALLPYELAIPLFLAVTVPLLWRRTAPIAAVGAALAGLVVNEALLGTEFIRCGVVLPTAFILAFAAGAQLSGRETHIGLTLALVLTLVVGGVEFGAQATTVVMIGLTTAMWSIGRVVHSRKRLAHQLEARNEELRDARDERARLEVASDRARLSRELDELLQRRLGELARMADEGSRPSNAATATAALAEIEHESRRTLEEMRELVGVMRHDAADAPTAPQPTLTHLEAMLVRAKGANARLRVEGSPRVLPAGVELSAYRIVEQLLSALDDAPDIDVRVRFADDSLELAVSGPARRQAKASIERARERARMQRGTLEATMRDGRAEAVVSLPVLAAV